MMMMQDASRLRNLIGYPAVLLHFVSQFLTMDLINSFFFIQARMLTHCNLAKAIMLLNAFQTTILC
jgi:hypothetical protein